MLKIENVTVRFGNKTAVDGVSFSVAPGQWWMIAGPNGAGKSTLISAMARSVAYSGGIFWDDREIQNYKSADYAKKVGILSQIHKVEYGFSVEEVVSLGRYAYQGGIWGRGDRGGRETVRKALEVTGLADMRQRPVTTLSGGEIQRVFLAQVFAQDPQLLILDEPANHLDLPYQRQLFSLITAWLGEGHRAVISVVHDLSLARRYGTHGLLMDGGRAAASGPKDGVFTRENLLRVYGMDVYGWMREMLAQWQE